MGYNLYYRDPFGWRPNGSYANELNAFNTAKHRSKMMNKKFRIVDNEGHIVELIDETC